MPAETRVSLARRSLRVDATKPFVLKSPDSLEAAPWL
jgi:hypothetical protein